MLAGKLTIALELLRTGSFEPGHEMERAHEICQEREGDPMFDWVHALVHRIEGDDGNAAYWYRRAGQSRHPGTVEEEWHILRAAIEAAQSQNDATL